MAQEQSTEKPLESSWKARLADWTKIESQHQAPNLINRVDSTCATNMALKRGTPAPQLVGGGARLLCQLPASSFPVLVSQHWLRPKMPHANKRVNCPVMPRQTLPTNSLL